MKHNLKQLMSMALALVMLVTLMGPVPAHASGKPSLNKKSAVLYVGGYMRLKLNGASGKVKWSSSDKKIASVSQKGRVTAKKAGFVTIMARNGEKIYKCKLRVKKSKLNRTKLTLAPGKKSVLKLNGARIRL